MLIVDDNIFNIVTVQTILQTMYGLEADKALNGQEAIELILKREQDKQTHNCHCQTPYPGYRLILMDCNMPVMDGFEATSKIKEMI